MGGASLVLGASRLGFGEPDLRAPVVVPEYERTLESVLLAVPAGTVSFGVPDAGDGLGVAALSRFLELAFHDLLHALPDYATIHAAAHRERRAVAARVLEPAGSRLVAHLLTEPDVEIELFAQDLGEPLTISGETKFLVSLRMDAGVGDASSMSAARRRTAEYVFGPENVIEADFVFEGGNLAFDRVGETTRVLAGLGAFRRTLEHYRRRDVSLSHRDVEAMMASAFHGAEIVSMDEERQRPLLQHIDQAFVLLKDSVAVANRLVGTELRAERRQLEGYHRRLRELGYELAFIDHDAEDLEKSYLSVNAVPYLDRASGARRILFPVFPGECDEDALVLSRNVLRSKAAKAYDVYRDVGYEPVPVRDMTHVLGGNTHCIVNALA